MKILAPMKYFSLLLIGLPMLATAQSQLALDTVSTQDVIIYNGTVASNGDRVLYLRNAAGVLLWRSTADGTPLWERQIGTSPLQTASQLSADSLGGVVLLQLLSTEQISNYPDEGLIDTLRLHYLLTRVDATGDIAWQRVVTTEYDHHMGQMYYVREASMGTGPDAVFLVVHTSNSEQDQISLLKFDMQGQQVWSRSFGTDYYVDGWELSKVVGDQAGGLFIRGADPYGQGHVYAGYADQDGTLNWWKRYDYVNASLTLLGGDEAMVMPDGSLLNYRKIEIPGHKYLSTFRMDPQGVVTDADFYAHPAVTYSNSAGLGLKDDGSIFLSTDSLLVHVDGTGEVLAAATLTSHVSDDQRNTFIPMHLNARPEGAVISGVLTQVHVDLGFTYYRPAVRTVDPGQPGCYVASEQVNHIPVPTDLYQVEDMEPYLEQPLQLNVLDSLGTNLPRPVLPTLELCQLMIPTGVGGIDGQETNDLLNTVARQGEPFRIATRAAGLINVLDAAGRTVVHDQRYTGGTAIQTHGWAPGLYVLCVSGQDGSAVRTYRVVVTP
ncbi:MAG TPA: hypothetical protein PLY76_11930 [Flavobacteriales bacterium]|nr:hypothetical protein [Flavobacteriales bacterium]